MNKKLEQISKIAIIDTFKRESDFLLYTTPDGKVRVEIFVKDENIWLTQERISQLFGVQRPAVTKHLKNIFESGELDKNSVSSILEHTTQHGAIKGKTQKQSVKYYNLDAIISVGYRVNSTQATRFRIWATERLKEYIIKGFTMDDERLKDPERIFGKDYFREILERIRSIRASERRIYQQITDIFAECSIDYDPRSQTTKDFFATIQNKFHFAITGHTAAEIIYEQADRKQPNMGLTTWKQAPAGRILSADVTVAKNYLPEKQIKKLERTVTGFFDYIENLIENRQAFTMEEFVESVNKFLTFNEYRILHGKGKISKADADKKALTEYKEFNKTQPIESDFDKIVKRLAKQKKAKTKLKKK
ncbi:MAG: cell filamentation protein Fic [Candidatus Pacebacteria bacterium CG_4_10_14_0_8_um_filter_42_14]|nr:MAG: cell filamentation protein Fic [Candidatus Pacebacteria bacterium CG_4_10_14_0_8_um_filter_42_14]